MFLGLFFIALVFTFLPMFLEKKDKSPFLLFWGMNVVFVLLPIFLNVIHGNYSEEIINTALFFYISCNITYSVTLIFLRRIFNPKKSSLEVRGIDLTESRNQVYILWGFSALLMLILIYNGVNFKHVLNSTLSDKRALASWYLFILYVSAYVFPFLIYTYFNKKTFLTMFLVFLYLYILFYFRSRSLISFVMLPISYYILFWSKKKAISFLLLICFAFFLSQGIKIIRYQGVLKNALSVKNLSETASVVMVSNFQKGSGDLSIGSSYLDIVQDHETSSWSGRWTFFNKIFSRILGEQRVETLEYMLWDFYFGTGTGGSLHPTAYGFCFADAGGFLGIFFFVFLAGIRMFVHLFICHKRNLGYLGFVMYFILFFSRGSVYNGFAMLLMGFFACFFINKILGYFSKRAVCI